MPKVSIIIPVYNSAKYLGQSLDSVVSQSFKDLEIVCINDGSTDDSLNILQTYEKQDSRIKIVNQQNGGGSAARNAGIEHATGDYVMFLDSDDMYVRDIVSSAYERAIHTNADIVLYNFARFVGKPTFLSVKNKITPGYDIDYFTKDNYSSKLFNDFATITWNKLIKKSVLTDNKIYFDTQLSHNHDVDFSIRLMLAADSYSWIEHIGYYYRANDQGLTATKRDDPTNVLKILIKLNELVVSRNVSLKQSFDSYAVDMISGTLAKYSDNASKQKEVFNFACSVLIPELGLAEKGEDYLFNESSRTIFELVKMGGYNEFIAYINQPKRILRARLRKLYNKAQVILSHFIV